MQEININKNTENKQQSPKPLLERLRELEGKETEDVKQPKIKKIRLPRKARVKKRALRKGYIGVLKIDENGNISGEKQRVSGFCFNTKDGMYHSTNGKEILKWDGKFPVVIQPSWKNNPLHLNPEEKNETYGQPYIKAKMLADTIKVKSKGGGIIIWILIAGAAIFGINYLMGGKFF